jgi:hypothetical protein
LVELEFDPYANRDRFRVDHEFAVTPLREVARSNYDGALKFADSGIKALFGLNGGGLIALPAFAALFKTDMRAVAVWVVAAMVMFVVGLICAALICFFGYVSAMKSVESAQNSMAATSAAYALHHQQINETPTLPAEINAAQTAAAQFAASAGRFRGFAVAAGVASLAAFIVAASLAGCALTPWAS